MLLKYVFLFMMRNLCVCIFCCFRYEKYHVYYGGEQEERNSNYSDMVMNTWLHLWSIVFLILWNCRCVSWSPQLVLKVSLPLLTSNIEFELVFMANDIKWNMLKWSISGSSWILLQKLYQNPLHRAGFVG